MSHEQAWALTGLSGSSRCQELQSRSEEEDCEGDDDDDDGDDGGGDDDDDDHGGWNLPSIRGIIDPGATMG